MLLGLPTYKTQDLSIVSSLASIAEFNANKYYFHYIIQTTFTYIYIYIYNTYI